MTRSELTAQTRFQQSMTAISRDSNRRSPYGLRTETGYLGARNPQTGLHDFTDATGVTSPCRDLQTGAYPIDHNAVAIEINGGQSYVR